MTKTTEQITFKFGAGKNEGSFDKNKYGGKAAGLFWMVEQGLPVPPGFCIPTSVCKTYMALSAAKREELLDTVMKQVENGLDWLTFDCGFKLPPLVSVRSGAPVSMPGMMDTILNVGLTMDQMFKWEEHIGPRAAWDSYRRLIQMLGETAFHVGGGGFDKNLNAVKKKMQVNLDSELDALNMSRVAKDHLKYFEEATGKPFPDKGSVQLRAAIKAVFDSWMNPRAIEYRKLNNISEEMGTAVVVQTMVFGNTGDNSGSGVLFTRDPSTGENKIMGEYLTNAQGEDVVAGIRTPEPLDKYISGSGEWDWGHQLVVLCEKLEDMYKDMVDVEFTVQDGQLYILQSRTGKRSAAAAFKIAHDLVEEGVITRWDAFTRITTDQFKIVRRPTIDPKFKTEADVKGLPACPGVATGIAVFSAQAAIDCTEPCILITHETNPNDIGGMAKAAGILTAMGGATSHAAVVARAMDKPCVVGCTDLDLDGLVKIPDPITVTIDGSTGRVWFATEVPLLDGSSSPELSKFMWWCMEHGEYVEATQFGKEEGINNRIVAAEWWDDYDAVPVVLGDLAKMKSRDGITLDVTPPASNLTNEDLELFYAFGEQHDTVFADAMVKAIAIMGDGLSGLTVIGLDHAPTFKSREKVLAKAGIKVPRKAITVADLLDGATATPEFVQTVLGGDEAYKKLRDILQGAGVVAHSVQEALPLEYAVFKVLQSAASGNQ